MTTPSTPSEIARETLKTLAARRLAATPDNYARVYQEIGGAASGSAESVQSSSDPKPVLAWPKLIRDLLKQMDTPHKGITVTRKKDGVETVLNKFSSNSDALYEKLQGLLNSWSDAPTAANLGELIPPEIAPVAAGTTPPATAAATPAVAPGAKVYVEMVAQLRELLAQALESSLTSEPDLAT